MPAASIQTEEELMAWYATHPWGDQDDNGFDLDRLRENRRLTPAERVAKFEAFRESVLWLQKVSRRASSL